MIFEQRRARFVIWFSLIVILLMTLMSAWQSVEEDATNTAVIVASKRMLERANLFKQQYLLYGKKNIAETSDEIHYSNTGWLLPIAEDSRSCDFWLSQLYPKKQILGVGSPIIEDMSDQTQFHCRYHYTNKYQIDVQLNQERFNIKANILAL
ncbi:MAG: MSHA biogenesis protein MshF [Vibrio gallaecicus]